MKKPGRPAERKTVRDTAIQPLGMHAVFCQREKMATARFVCLHETYEEASREAIRLLTESVQSSPEADRVFYVVEIEGCFTCSPTDGLRATERPCKAETA